MTLRNLIAIKRMRHLVGSITLAEYETLIYKIDHLSTQEKGKLIKEQKTSLKHQNKPNTVIA